jgi:hypothetical protein
MDEVVLDQNPFPGKNTIFSVELPELLLQEFVITITEVLPYSADSE